MSKVIQTVEELDAVLHWRGKHAQAIKERDALQQLLNQRDEQVETLKLQHQVEAAPKSKPVAKLHAERLTGRDGEYGITVEDSQWFNTCRLTGGEFNLYAEQPAPVAVLLAEAREWLGDGKNSDGLSREHWTPEYAALIDRIDATLRK